MKRVLFLLGKIRFFLGRKKILVDCGANVGEVSLAYLNRGYRVIAFEPNPYAYTELVSRFMDDSRVKLVQKAVWDRNTTLKLFLHENSDKDEVFWSQGSSLLEFKGNVRKDKTVEVEVVDLIEYFKDNNLDHVDVLKIDIEGAEVELLEKIIETKFYHRVGKIFVETHDHKIPELKERTDNIRQRIASLGITNISLDWV